MDITGEIVRTNEKISPLLDRYKKAGLDEALTQLSQKHLRNEKDVPDYYKSVAIVGISDQQRAEIPEEVLKMGFYFSDEKKDRFNKPGSFPYLRIIITDRPVKRSEPGEENNERISGVSIAFEASGDMLAQSFVRKGPMVSLKKKQTIPAPLYAFRVEEDRPEELVWLLGPVFAEAFTTSSTRGQA